MAPTGIDWTIICATYGRAEARYSALLKSADEMRSRGASISAVETLGLADSGTILHCQGYREWLKALREKARRLTFDFVLTHNRLGEYGHPHHMALSAIARDLFTVPISYFYFRGGSSVGPQEKLDTVVTVKMTPEERERKQHVFQNAYPGLYHPIQWNQPELMQIAMREESFTA